MGQLETRNSLILRLHDQQDAEAWNEFATIYQPLVYRLARRMGMQDSSAIEATQEVMLHLAGVVQRWQPDPARGTFRGWLYRVAKNVMLRFMERESRQPRAVGDSAQWQRLAEIPADTENSNVFDLEFKKQVFAWATNRVKTEFETTTWRAFQQTFLGDMTVASFAAAHGVSTGAVYVARCRVLKRLQQVVREQLDRDWIDLPQDVVE